MTSKLATRKKLLDEMTSAFLRSSIPKSLMTELNVIAVSKYIQSISPHKISFSINPESVEEFSCFYYLINKKWCAQITSKHFSVIYYFDEEIFQLRLVHFQDHKCLKMSSGKNGEMAISAFLKFSLCGNLFDEDHDFGKTSI